MERQTRRPRHCDSDCFDFWIALVVSFRLRTRNGPPTEEENPPPSQQDRRTNELGVNGNEGRKNGTIEIPSPSFGLSLPCLGIPTGVFCFSAATPSPFLFFLSRLSSMSLPVHPPPISSTLVLAFTTGVFLGLRTSRNVHYYSRPLPRSTTWVTSAYFQISTGMQEKMGPNNNRRCF
jgi:hypothetical protein